MILAITFKNPNQEEGKLNSTANSGDHTLTNDKIISVHEI